MVDVTHVLLLTGRLLFGGYFLFAAYNHLAKGGGLVGYAKMKGVKRPALAVYGSGLLLLLGGALVLTGSYPAIGLLAIVLFLAAVTPKMHAFWNEQDPMARMGEQVNFLKNAALLGAAIALMAVPEPWAFAL